MSEEIMTENQNQTVESTDVNYIDVINNLRNNTVSKSEYEKVMRENRMLANQLATTPATSAEEEETVIPTAEELTAMKTKMSKMTSCSNLEFISAALNYREAVIASGGRDPFLPLNHEYVDNEFDDAKAAAIADGLRQMVDYSAGDAKLFDSELKRCCK